MNYWPRWINAITNATAHLSLVEMGAYDRLLDHYYKTEAPLPASLDDCCRIVRAMSKQERDAVQRVLAQFFTLGDGGHSQPRADQEIEQAQAKIEAARSNGAKGGRPKGTHKKPTGLSVGTQEEPRAKAHQHQSNTTPLPPAGVAPPIQPTKTQRVSAPDDVAPQVWADWTTLRKAKKAPVTATVLDGARSEAAKAGLTLEAFLRVWCSRGSQGLQADWLKPHERPQQASAQPTEPAWRTEQRQRMREFAGADLVNPAPQRQTAEVIDVTPRLVG